MKLSLQEMPDPDLIRQVQTRSNAIAVSPYRLTFTATVRAGRNPFPLFTRKLGRIVANVPMTSEEIVDLVRDGES
jgi:hypothetical protein